MKNILIISRDFIPYYRNAGGVSRVIKMIEFFLKNNVNVFVLAAKGEEIGYFGYEDLIKKINVFYIGDWLQVYLNKRYKHSAMGYPEYNAFESIAKRLNRALSIPDKAVYFVKKYIKKALEIIEEYKIENVLISSPPHSSQIIGLALKKRLGKRINLIVDYRDSWSGTFAFKKKALFFRMLSEKLEMKVLEAADYFICISEPILRKINKKYFDISHKASLIMSGFDKKKSLEKETPVKNSRFTIGYFGTMDSTIVHYRNPELFFEALSGFGEKIKLFLCGDIKIDRFWQEKLDGILEIRRPVLPDEALRLMKTMDILLFLHSQRICADEVMGGKFYDYLASGRPIFVVGPKEMEVARLVEEEGLGYVLDIYNKEEMVGKMNDIYQQWQKGGLLTYNINNLEKYTVESQYSKLLDMLK